MATGQVMISKWTDVDFHDYTDKIIGSSMDWCILNIIIVSIYIVTVYNSYYGDVMSKIDTDTSQKNVA